LAIKQVGGNNRDPVSDISQKFQTGRGADRYGYVGLHIHQHLYDVAANEAGATRHQDVFIPVIISDIHVKSL
jgi:hypothetical protein